LGATAASAAALGAGVAVWRLQAPEVPAAEPPVDGFWAMQWDTPQGTRLTMESFRGKPLLINFWATWCTPCVEELPLINDFYRQNRMNGWQVLALAVDKLAPVQSFLQRMPLDFPVGMAGATGTELGRALGNLAGGLPFSVVLSGDGMVVQRKLGRLTPDDLTAWLRLK
jgi:thiol-disulfide isomerase/thioredoxin